MVFAVEEQDPNQIEYFEFSLPGVYEQKVVKGEPVFEVDEDDQPDESMPVYTRTPRVFKLPQIQYLGIDMVEKMETQGIRQVLLIFGDSADYIRKLNGKQLNALAGEWRRQSRTSLGESEASDDS